MAPPSSSLLLPAHPELSLLAETNRAGDLIRTRYERSLRLVTSKAPASRRKKIFFVAGVEGTGHHTIFGLLSHFTSRSIENERLTGAAYSAWANTDASKFASNQTQLVQAVDAFVHNESWQAEPDLASQEAAQCLLAPVAPVPPVGFPECEPHCVPAPLSFPYGIERQSTSRPDFSHFVRIVQAGGVDLRMLAAFSRTQLGRLHFVD